MKILIIGMRAQEYMLGLVRRCFMIRGQINSNEDVETQNSMSKLQMRMLGKEGQGGVSPWLNKAEVRKCILLSRVTFQEILLIKIIHYERTRQIGARKYLRESCYYCIECSAANSLAALMRK